jgi:hypothetical protein
MMPAHPVSRSMRNALYAESVSRLDRVYIRDWKGVPPEWI